MPVNKGGHFNGHRFNGHNPLYHDILVRPIPKCKKHASDIKHRSDFFIAQLVHVP